MRAVNLKFDTDQMHATIALVGTEEFDRALSYLSTWNMSFPVVDVYIMDDELNAVYRRRPYEDGDPPGYVIGAVFNGTKFGFHS